MKAPKFTEEQVEEFKALYKDINHVLHDYPRNVIFSILGAFLEKLITSETDDHNTALNLVGGFTEILVESLDMHYAEESKLRGHSGAKE
jgi:hypothetical protein